MEKKKRKKMKIMKNMGRDKMGFQAALIALVVLSGMIILLPLPF